MPYAYLALIFILGLVVGSFLSAYTYRLVRGISVIKGRSFCPNCKKKIAWFDNIPLLSFILLKGKCRNCRKKISWRYPLIELATALSFVTITFLVNQCSLVTKGSAVCHWFSGLGFFAYPYLLLIGAVMVAVFITDIESQIIPDDLILFLLLITIFLLLLSSSPFFYTYLFSGFAAAVFLLLLHLTTKGRGMGLGDVKFALLAGALLGWPQTAGWLFSAFLTGAIVGIILILLGKASFGKNIAFAPFLVASLALTLVWGEILTNWLFPYLF